MSKRPDAIGFFWQDLPVEKKAAVEKVKRTPPERVWERPDYLPGLEEARAFRPDFYTDYEIGQAARNGEPLVFDTEVYPNYVLFAFRGLISRKVIAFELDSEPLGRTFDQGKLFFVLTNFCIINFNGRKYDFIIAAMGVHRCSTEQMWEATRMIIEFGLFEKDVFARFKVPKLPKINQIDLIELTPLAPGLKVCAGRLHAKKMQDLPFVPGTCLTDDQIAILYWYCFNDLDNTELLYGSLKEQLDVRIETGKEYGLDLRSFSDPQMAEAIIGSELKKVLRVRHIKKTVLPVRTTYKFKAAPFLQYATPLLQHVLKTVKDADWAVDEFEGNIVLPKSIVPVTIANATYAMGVGGLHSQEKSVSHVAGKDYFIADTDATSYYPRLILNAGIAPANLGQNFLRVYNNIVETRIEAKRKGLAAKAESLKIVVNGTFGKLGSKHSNMYAPDLMMQVTVTGQLSLLLLIERFELAGIEVLQANTDGIVTKCLRSREDVFYGIVKQWEADTGFSTEEVRYSALYSRDVNNYIAVYEKLQKGKKVKGKGVYAATSSKKNAVNEVCIEAVVNLLTDGVPIMTTLKACQDISKFTSMRRVTGGAVKDGIYLGKIIRWYYSTNSEGELIYAKTGNKVPRSDGAKPCMNLPDKLPEDIDYEWYANEAQEILVDIGHTAPPAKK